MATKNPTPLLYQLREGSVSDPYVDKLETIKLVEGRAILDEIPIRQFGIIVDNHVEIGTNSPTGVQFYVDYTNGVLYFEPTKTGSVTVRYKGRGVVQIPSDRIFHPDDNENQNLAVTLDSIKQITKDARESADLAAGYIDNAKVQGDHAKTQGDYAKVQGDIAVEKAELADSSSIAALEARDLAEEKANLADEAAKTSLVTWLNPVDTYSEVATIYPNPIESNQVQVRDTGDIYRFENGQWNAHSFSPTHPQNMARHTDRFVATQGQKDFNTTKPYFTNQDRIDVYVSGIKQVSGVDFNETSPTKITLVTGCEAGEIVETVYLKTTEAQALDLIEQVEAAETATLDAIAAKEEALEASESTRLNWKDPVANFAALATTYPTATKGWTSATKDNGKIYRHNGTEWKLIQEVDLTAYNALDTKLTSQLADKVSQQAINDLDNRLSAEMADTAYNVTLQDNKIDANTNAIANVLNSGTKVNLFPKYAGAWGLGIFGFAVGQPSTSSGYVLTSINYRHDTVDLIKVKPGAVLTFTVSGDYKVAVHQFDANKLGIVDSGYQTTTLALNANTHYIRLICSRNDSANHSIDDIVNNANIVVSINVSDLPELPASKPVVQNLIPTSVSLWENGGIDTSGNYSNVTNRLRPVQGLWISPITRMRKFYYNVATGYRLSILGYDNGNISRFDSGWKTGNGSFYVPENVTKLVPILSHPDDSVISISEVINAQPLLATENILFEYAKTDVTKTVETVNTRQVEENVLALSEEFRYVAHRGLMEYAPENTLESMRLAAFVGTWGVEVDLGMTSDGKLVLMHDYTVDRTTDGTGNVSSLTLAQVQALNVDASLKGFTNVKVPTLEQLLDVCKETGLFPVIEVKEDGNTSGMTDATIAVLEKYNFMKSCVIESFSVDVLKRIRSKNKSVKLAYLLPGGSVITNTHIATAKSIGNCLLFADATAALTSAMVQSAKKEGIPVWCWGGVVSDALANSLIAIGVDSITSDNLFPKRRERKVFHSTVRTLDSGATWSHATSMFRDKVTVSPFDATTLEITFDNPTISTYIVKFDPIITAREITGAVLPMEINSTYNASTGKLRLKFYHNGALVNLNALPRSYVSVYFEVIF